MNLLNQNYKAALLSPASYLDESRRQYLELGIDYLRGLGFEVIPGKHLYAADRFMAGTDEQRAADLMQAFSEPQIKIIFTAAGGAGSQRLLPLLDYDIIRSNPKPLVGFSDMTALQLGLWQKAQTPIISGLALSYDFKNGHLDGRIDETLKKILGDEPITAQGGETVKGGKCEGILLGGCLSMIRNLSGTPYYPDLKDKILIIEDIGEKVHKIDLMLTQIRQNPGFNEIKALVFGEFTNCDPADEFDGTVEDVINDFCRRVSVPVIKNFPYGHTPSRTVLPLGTKFQLDADECRLEQIA